MFTGIVKETGRLKSLTRGNSLIKLGIISTIVSSDAKVSDSISINGVCLTLIYKEKQLLFFEAITTTLKNTNLKKLKAGDFINLEPALNLQDKLGGHFVLGHVDAELKLKRIIKKSGHWQLEVDLPYKFRKFVIENGSIAIEGISLTIKKVLSKTFSVDIVSFTRDNTNLKYKRAGNRLNTEFDYLLKRRSSEL